MNEQRAKEIIRKILLASKPENNQYRQQWNQLTDFEFLIDAAEITPEELNELGVQLQVVYSETDEPICVDPNQINFLAEHDKEIEFIEKINACIKTGNTGGICSIEIQCDDDLDLCQIHWSIY